MNLIDKTKKLLRYQFPPLESAAEDGLLAVGGTLDLSYLVSAYYQGVFPWPANDRDPVLWFSPKERGILFFDELRINRTTEKFLKKQTYRISVNESFKQVIENCANMKRSNGKSGTWITGQMIEAYQELHREGFAHSVEVWESDLLIGGIYGVCVAGVFSAESMFSIRSNASKLAFINLVEWLRLKEFSWMDVQMITPVVASLGGRLVSQKEYSALLQSAHVRIGFI